MFELTCEQNSTERWTIQLTIYNAHISDFKSLLYFIKFYRNDSCTLILNSKDHDKMCFFVVVFTWILNGIFYNYYHMTGKIMSVK